MSQTINQHYVSQAEQRLNAINPGAKPRNQRIYQFDLVDRDARIVRLRKPQGAVIASNLSMDDLFSFDVDKGQDVRENLEREFGRYESLIRPNTESLLAKHATRDPDCKGELTTLFVCKMMNFVRNPYSIAKVLNTFPALANHHPTDPAIYAVYERIMTGQKPHQAALCARLGISDEQYSTWLRIIFMLLVPLAGGRFNFLEDMMKGIFEDRDHEMLVHIHRYGDQRCLLSDRSISWPVEQADHLVLDFNLCSTAFIRFASLSHDTVVPSGIPPMIRAGLRRGPKQMHVSFVTDDLKMLEVFHRRVIEQCHGSVYCSGRDPYGVTVLPPADV